MPMPSTAIEAGSGTLGGGGSDSFAVNDKFHDADGPGTVEHTPAAETQDPVAVKTPIMLVVSYELSLTLTLPLIWNVSESVIRLSLLIGAGREIPVIVAPFHVKTDEPTEKLRKLKFVDVVEKFVIVGPVPPRNVPVPAPRLAEVNCNATIWLTIVLKPAWDAKLPLALIEPDIKAALAGVALAIATTPPTTAAPIVRENQFIENLVAEL